MGISYLLNEIVEQFEQFDRSRNTVGGRIDADYSIAAAVKQAIKNAGRDGLWIVGRMIWLKPNRKRSGQTDG